MPTDSSGVYTLPGSYLATTGQTILTSQHNPIFEDVAAALTGRLSRNGSAPMTGSLKGLDGSAAAPGYTFGIATTTGFYRTPGGNIGVTIGGVEVAEFGSGGIVKGSRYIGEIFDWTGSTAPALCVLPYGQTLPRAAYPDLWAFAQIEIAAGNTLYNNGDGSTTFGVPDLRGRIRAGKDNMGGTAASRLTSATITPDGNTLGAAGGSQTQGLTLAHVPTGITSVGTFAMSTTNFLTAPTTGFGATLFSATSGATVFQAFSSGAVLVATTPTASGTVTSNNTSGTAHPNVQSTLITNCALFAGA